jgi:hypothetical protein
MAGFIFNLNLIDPNINDRRAGFDLFLFVYPPLMLKSNDEFNG